MAAESSEGLPISPSEKSLTGSLVSEENEKSVSRSPSTYSIREDKWPDLVVSRPRKLDAWWLPRRKYYIARYTGACFRSAFGARFKVGSFGYVDAKCAWFNVAQPCVYIYIYIYMYVYSVVYTHISAHTPVFSFLYRDTPTSLGLTSMSRDRQW